MTHSESIGNIAAALVKAQAAIKPVHKTSTNPFFHSKYANLEAVSEACMSALGANGIAVVQSPSGGDGATVGITTMLLHTSGEWLCETAVYPLAKSDPQGVGSAITYGRRYGLAAMVGLVSDEDDDGNGASANIDSVLTAMAKCETVAELTRAAGKAKTFPVEMQATVKKAYAEMKDKLNARGE